ncbi:MAG: helix-turn-helix domain-containing protein [Thermoanaerobaculia bacterium]
MIVHHFPRPCPPAGWPNLVIHARGKAIEYRAHEAPLSIKCVFQGQEVHEVGGVAYVVDENSYLLLNHGQRYSSRIGPEQETETFSIFFERKFTQRALHSWLDSPDRLLEDPDRQSEASIDLVESLYPKDPVLSRLLLEIRRESDARLDDRACLEEHLYALLGHLLSRHAELLQRIEALPAVRQTTRVEQYRRLRRARDFIDANLGGQLSLAEIARIACLSPYHLLRLFKRAFGQTPHQYKTERRLQQARELLVRTASPVSEICNRVGYESIGSFGSRFKRRFGVSPGRLRSDHLETRCKRARSKKTLADRTS